MDELFETPTLKSKKQAVKLLEELWLSILDQIRAKAPVEEVTQMFQDYQQPNTSLVKAFQSKGEASKFLEENFKLLNSKVLSRTPVASHFKSKIFNYIQWS